MGSFIRMLTEFAGISATGPLECDCNGKIQYKDEQHVAKVAYLKSSGHVHVQAATTYLAFPA